MRIWTYYIPSVRCASVAIGQHVLYTCLHTRCLQVYNKQLCMCIVYRMWMFALVCWVLSKMHATEKLTHTPVHIVYDLIWWHTCWLGPSIGRVGLFFVSFSLTDSRSVGLGSCWAVLHRISLCISMLISSLATTYATDMHHYSVDIKNHQVRVYLVFTFHLYAHIQHTYIQPMPSFYYLYSNCCNSIRRTTQPFETHTQALRCCEKWFTNRTDGSNASQRQRYGI